MFNLLKRGGRAIKKAIKSGEVIGLPDHDYKLTQNAAWVELAGYAVRIYKTDEGIIVDVFDNEAFKQGDIDAVVASTYAFDQDLSTFSEDES